MVLNRAPETRATSPACRPTATTPSQPEPSGRSSSLSVTGCERDKHTGDQSDVLYCVIVHVSCVRGATLICMQ